ncbi:MAG TPA: hypothetical protein DCW60_02635 [Sutterella sp.]|nr:hypothetical protein [Sutterella sp.]
MKEEKESFFYWFFVKDDHAGIKTFCAWIGIFTLFCLIYSFFEGKENLMEIAFLAPLYLIPYFFVTYYLTYWLDHI